MFERYGNLPFALKILQGFTYSILRLEKPRPDNVEFEHKEKALLKAYRIIEYCHE
jgi:hypothetical protein